MKVIGITGQIGSGKSSVAKLLATYGARVLNADAMAKELLEQETPSYGEIVEAFGMGILHEDESIDRAKLAAIVFADPERLQLLNSIIHPRVLEEMTERVRYIDSSGEGVEVVAIDVPILFGSGADRLCDKVAAVLADEGIRLERMTARGMTESDFFARSGAQMSQDELATKADFVIENNGTLAELKEKVADLWRAVREDD